MIAAIITGLRVGAGDEPVVLGIERREHRVGRGHRLGLELDGERHQVPGLGVTAGDVLAVAAAQQRNLPADEVYERENR